jgi:hypothetical protein
MTVIFSRAFRLAALALFASAFQPHQALAQAADTGARSSLLTTVRARVPAGEVVHVTDVHGKTVTGVLGSVSSEVVEVTGDGGTWGVFARDVQRIRWQRRDSWVSGAVIGAVVGAIPGIYYLISDPNECAGLCPEEYALIGVGALVGALLDKAVTRKVTVYENPAQSGCRSVALSAVLTGARRGMQLIVSF